MKTEREVKNDPIHTIRLPVIHMILARVRVCRSGSLVVTVVDAEAVTLCETTTTTTTTTQVNAMP